MALDPAYVRHTAGPAWGVGVLVARTAALRTYLFTDGGLRAFKEEYCERFIVPAEPPSREDDERLQRGRSAGGIATPMAIHLELEAQIDARPDDPEPYVVYADWLQQRRDPRGELIAIQHALARAPEDAELRAAERALLEAHGAYLLPPLLAQMLRQPRRRGEEPATRCDVAWHHGFLASAHLGRKPAPDQPEIAAIADELLGHPSAHYLRRLAIGALGTPEEFDYVPAIAAIARRAPAHLEELAIGEFGSDMALAFSRAENVAPLVGALPRLARLTLRAGSLRFESAVRHPRLRALAVEVAAISAGNLRRLLRAELPALESLDVACPDLDLGGAELAAALRGDGMPRLRRLALRHTVDTRRALEEILYSPAMARLEVLELPGGDLDDAAAEELATIRAPRLAHLARLDVSGNAISPEAARHLASRCGNVAAAPAARGALDEDDVIARAPDARSLVAARAIALPARWQRRGRDGARLWGEYDGADSHYVWARLDARESGCDCPSPKDPCKHVLALLLLATAPQAFAAGPIPAAFLRRSYERPRYPVAPRA